MAWVTLGALQALGDIAAADLVQRPTQTRAAVDGRVVAGTAAAVSAALADNQVIQDAAVDAMLDAAVQANVRWNKLALSQHADALRAEVHSGLHRVASTADAIAYGLPEAFAGTLEVEWVRGNASNGVAQQTYKPEISATRTWRRRSTTLGWRVWERSDIEGAVETGVVHALRSVPSGANLNEYILREHDGDWGILDSALAGTLTGWPFTVGGQLHVSWVRGTTTSSATCVQVATSELGEVMRRRSSSAAGWYDWTADTGGTPVVVDAEVTQVDVIIAAGQSNMSGRGTPFGAPYGDRPDGRVWEYRESNYTLRPAQVPLDMHDDSESAGLSPATEFARQWVRNTAPGTVALIIPAAHGATGFDPSATWNWSTASGSTSLTEAMLAQTASAITAAQSQWPAATITPRVMLWHQGENIDGLADSEAYITAFSTLVSRVRAVYADMPVVMGELSPDRTGGALARTALNTIPERLTRTALAHTPANGSRTGDLSHLGREAIMEMGRRMFDVYPAAVAGADGVLVMPPYEAESWRDGDIVRAEWSPPLCRWTQPFLVHASADGGETWAGTGVTVLGRRAEITRAGVTHVRIYTRGSETSNPHIVPVT